MRENHYGKIINVTSMGRRIWTMLGAWYHAGKFAVEGFSNSLRIETKPFGIDVIVVEPGGIKTEWGDISADHLEEYSFGGAYAAKRRATPQCCASSMQGTISQSRSLLPARYPRQ